MSNTNDLNALFAKIHQLFVLRYGAKQPTEIYFIQPDGIQQLILNLN